jgi:hypothetical protein
MSVIPGNNLRAAQEHADSNAKWFNRPYVIFTDTSGNLRVERLPIAPANKDWIQVVYPPDWNGAITSVFAEERRTHA